MAGHACFDANWPRSATAFYGALLLILSSMRYDKRVMLFYHLQSVTSQNKECVLNFRFLDKIGQKRRDCYVHQRRKCEGYFSTSLWPKSYLGVIPDLYVLNLKTKVFCRKNNQIHFSMDTGLTVPNSAVSLAENTPNAAKKNQPKMSAQVQKFRIFEKKALRGVRSPWLCLSNN